jgi:type II secretory pathway pseudopilin PulG
VFIAIAAYVVFGMPLQAARAARKQAEAAVTSSSLAQLAQVLELYREDWNRYPVANNTPITRKLVNVWALSPTWTTYTIVAPGVFSPDALARFPTTSGKPCALTCSRLVWKNDRVVAL